MRCSVIIPVKNGAHTIEACLSAITSQVSTNDEILVIDDHSTDTTCKLVSRYPVRQLACRTDTTGAGAARNVGVKEAKGRILVFLDADVVVTPNALNKLLEPLSNGADASIGYYDDNRGDLGTLSWIKNTTVRARHQRSGENIKWFWTAFGALSKSTFEAVGGFDERHFSAASVEDMDLGFRLSHEGKRIVQVFDAVVQHHHHFGPMELLKNDFRKSRDWARLLTRSQWAMAQAHASTKPSELAALLCSVMLIVGLLFCWYSIHGIGVALIGGVGLATTLAEEIALVRSEGSAGDVVVYLAVRALLYPVAAIGAAWGTATGALGVQST